MNSVLQDSIDHGYGASVNENTTKFEILKRIMKTGVYYLAKLI